MTNINALSIEQVRAVTGLGRTKIYQLIGAGELPAKKVGKRTIVLESDLRNFLESLPQISIREVQ